MHGPWKPLSKFKENKFKLIMHHMSKHICSKKWRSCKTADICHAKLVFKHWVESPTNHLSHRHPAA